MIEPLLAKEAAEHALEGAAMKLLELYDLIGLQPEMIKTLISVSDQIDLDQIEPYLQELTDI